MKKVLCVIEAGLVVGAVAATLYYMNNKKASEEACEHKKFDDKFETENSEKTAGCRACCFSVIYAVFFLANIIRYSKGQILERIAGLKIKETKM